MKPPPPTRLTLPAVRVLAGVIVRANEYLFSNLRAAHLSQPGNHRQRSPAPHHRRLHPNRRQRYRSSGCITNLSLHHSLISWLESPVRGSIMYGNPIFQRYHSQVFAQFSYKYPMPNAPVFWLNLAPSGLASASIHHSRRIYERLGSTLSRKKSVSLGASMRAIM